MGRTIKGVFLFLFLFAWLYLMHVLSTADGEETLEQSMALAEKIADKFFGEYSDTFLEYLNNIIRKLAHVAIYLILGFLVAAIWDFLLCNHLKVRWRALFSLITTSAIAFLDEYQKIPISGRHFDKEEVVLNAVCAAAVVICYFFIIYLIEAMHRHRQRKREKKKKTA